VPVVRRPLPAGAPPATPPATPPVASAAAATDFLNEYLSAPHPIDLATFRMQLTGAIAYPKSDGYCEATAAVRYVPERLTMDQLLVGVAQVEIRTTALEQMLPSKMGMTADEVSSLLPTLEILRNKLLTITKPDGATESLLYSSSLGGSNNNRPLMKTDLTTENTGSGGDESSTQWRVFSIGDEACLALAAGDLLCLGTPLFGMRYSDTGRHFYRKRDVHMTADLGIFDPETLTFLFKLHVVQS
jgi:hypothetical protein